MLKRFVSIILFLAMSMGAAIADDWVVSKMRGGVFIFKAGEWVQLERGDVISDDSAIQTAKHARVVLTRGEESISVAADTRIRIADKNGAKRTVVSQDFGAVTVDVEKRNVQHFEVRSPLLAAVVKGTRFTVTARDGKASIDVQRGRVEARDDRAGMKVDVKRNQSVGIDRTTNPVLTVEGRGAKEPILSIKTNKRLSVKEIISQVTRAHPKSPVGFDKVFEIAAQQGVELSKDDLKFAAKSELKAAQKSGDKLAIAKAKASTNAVENNNTPLSSGADANAVKALNMAAEQQAKAEKLEAEKALEAAQASGDASAIAAATKAVNEAKENEKAVEHENKAAEAELKAGEAAAKAAEDAVNKAVENAVSATTNHNVSVGNNSGSDNSGQFGSSNSNSSGNENSGGHEDGNSGGKGGGNADKGKQKGVVGSVLGVTKGLLGG